MLMFATEFPARSGASSDDVLAIAMQWLYDSPHHQWKSNDLKEALPWTKEQFVKDGETVEIIAIDDQYYWIGLKHIWTENRSRVWTTEIISRETEDSLVISVRLFCDSLIPGDRPPFPKKPHVLKALIKGIGGGQDGEFFTSDKPIVLTESDLDVAADIVQANCKCRLPVIYISANKRSQPFIDATHLARWMSCIAHVVVEPSVEFNKRLAEYTGQSIPYESAVAIYWPRSSAPRYLFTPNPFSDGRQMAIAISTYVRRTLAFARPSNDFMWPFLTELLAERRVIDARNELKRDADKIQKEYDQQVVALKARIEELIGEKERLRLEIQAADKGRGANTGGGFLLQGREKEFYKGEHADIVVEALEQAVNSTFEGSRKRHVIEDIIFANPVTTYRKDAERKIKAALNGKRDFDSGARKDLAQLGFEWNDSSRHPNICYRGDPRYTFTLAKTASDHRSIKNTVGEICRILFK